MIWRVNREAVVALAGTCAILMQLAHPGVAAGVRDHSRFESDPAGRLRRTFDLSLAWVFGSRDKALEAARIVNRRHEAVKGPGYSAKDPELLLWVQATLAYASINGYRAFVANLTDEDANRYYDDTKEIGVLLGIAPPMYPSDLEALNRYIEGMIDSGQVRVSDDALRMGRILLQPHFPGVPRMAFTPLRTITAGLLPPPLREQYGLAWGRTDRLLFGGYRAALPRVLRVAPASVRFLPHARHAYRRLRLQPA
jgi:uncharacterized protein (DUF2236 family)